MINKVRYFKIPCYKSKEPVLLPALLFYLLYRPEIDKVIVSYLFSFAYLVTYKLTK